MIAYTYYHPIELTPTINLEKAHGHRNHSKIYSHCRQHTLVSQQEQREWFERQHKDPTIKMFAISDGITQVGVCGFTSIDMLNRNAEFSLYVGPEFQGYGYGVKALKTLLRHGFEDWGFKRIWGEVFSTNVRAKSVFDYMGFKTEGTLRKTYWKKGQWIDSHIISLLRGEIDL